MTTVKTNSPYKAANLAHLFPMECILACTERLIRQQDEFRAAGKPTRVDLGFHYTCEENIDSIRSHGLLNSEERTSRGIVAAKDNGAIHGVGIYTATDFRAYHGQFGSVGIVVARLLGASLYTGHDSVTVYRHERDEVAVVRSSTQCIPILQFDATRIIRHFPLNPGNLALDMYYAALLEVVDKFFNTTLSIDPIRPTASHPIVADPSVSIDPNTATPSVLAAVGPMPKPNDSANSAADCMGPLAVANDNPPAEVTTCANPMMRTAAASRRVSESKWRLKLTVNSFYRKLVANRPVAPQYLPPKRAVMTQITTLYETIRYTKPSSEQWMQSRTETLMGSSTGKLGHQQQCPVPRGAMPSGTMIVQYCCIFDAMKIEYIVPGGVQECYHAHPGKRHIGTYQVALLPANEQGRDVLARLKYAFRHGLTFTVTSCGRVTWTSIRHRSVERGCPDERFLSNCHHDLDTLHVPAASCLSYAENCDM
jgi:Deltex C-terminal domain